MIVIEFFWDRLVDIVQWVGWTLGLVFNFLFGWI